MHATRNIGLLAALYVVFGSVTSSQPASAQVAPPFTALYDFTDGYDGADPMAPLIQDRAGFLYGTTSAGGAGAGTVFGIAFGGGLQLYTFPFTGNEGANSTAGLLLGRDGSLYGATQRGGVNGTGTLFRTTLYGELTVLYTFSATSFNASANGFINAEGANPKSGLIQDVHGNLYGVASTGGANGAGTVFKLSPKGTLTVLHTFSGADGVAPSAPLIQGNDGNYYGTTYNGGAEGQGTVFKITPEGVFTTVYSFAGALDGGQPYAGLLQAEDGNLYGVASTGGAGQKGTLFRITLDGALTTLHSFSGINGQGHNADGAFPIAGLIQGRDGNLYGAVAAGGANGSGTLFGITLTGAFRVLYTFTNLSPQLTNRDGAFPAAALLQGADGNLYGTASRGGSRGGSVFKLTMTPVITGFAPAYGPVGTSVTVTGMNFAEATAVTLGGISASFTINSDTSLTLTVPAGASNGRIAVFNPFGRRASNALFKITP